MLCIPIFGPSLSKAKEQVLRAAPLADLLELRLDLFAFQEVEPLLAMTNLPFLFTLKGGDLKRVRQLVSYQPAFFDLESEAPLALFEEIKALSPKTKRICSWHHFSKTPSNLDALYTTLQKRPAELYKMVPTAQSALDALRVAAFLKRSGGGRLIAFAMGEEGRVSRLLAPVFGAPISYCCLDGQRPVASGQITAEQMVGLYRFRQLGPGTRLFGLIGDPVERSVGHLFHNRAFEALGLNALYLKFRVEMFWLDHFLQLAQEVGIEGLSVTMPLKEAVLPFLSKAPPCLAVNTLFLRDGKLFGCNTDGRAAAQAIKRRCSIRGKLAIILGAGGTARAVAAELLRQGADLLLLNRTEEKAAHLADQLGCRWGLLTDFSGLRDYAAVVNATAASMAEELPIDPAGLLPGAVAMDVVYGAGKTPFLKEAEKRGCLIVEGSELFLGQAALQLAWWLGADPPS